jgi:hypothetical protein
MAPGAAHRRVTARLLAIGVSMVLLLTIGPASIARAAGHVDAPFATLEIPGSGSGDAGARELETNSFWFGPGEDRLHAFTDPSGALAGFGTFFLDVCDSAGTAWVFGANGTDERLDIMLFDPANGQTTSYVAPPGSPSSGDPGAWFNEHAAACGGQHLDAPGRRADLNGTLDYDGISKQCGDFAADFAIRQSRPGRGYDRITFRGNQQNRIISDHPLIAVDTSKAFDELTILRAPAAGDSLEDMANATEGVVLGGGPDILPTIDELRRWQASLTPEEIAELADDSISRVRAGKRPRKLLKSIGADGSPCAYHVQADIDAGSKLAVTGDVLEILQPAPPLLPRDGRFKVALEWAGESSEVPGVDVRGDATAADVWDSGNFWFFDPESTGLLVKVLDGCEFNDHFWLFAAATTDVEFTLTVTDTLRGESASYDNPLGQSLEPILDTSAFATCP